MNGERREERGEHGKKTREDGTQRGGKAPSESESVWYFQLFGKAPVYTVHGDEASQTAINIGLESAWNPPQIQREREEWEGPSESIIRRIFLVARAWETNTAPANPHRVALASVVSLPTNAHVAVARSR